MTGNGKSSNLPTRYLFPITRFLTVSAYLRGNRLAEGQT